MFEAVFQHALLGGNLSRFIQMLMRTPPAHAKPSAFRCDAERTSLDDFGRLCLLKVRFFAITGGHNDFARQGTIHENRFTLTAADAFAFVIQ